MTLAQEMNAALDAELDAEFAQTALDDEDTDVEVKHPFVIDNESKADWALRKLGAEESAVAKAKQLAREEIERITTWCDEEVKRHQGSIDHFTSLLVSYHREQLSRDEKRKTINLPHGTLSARQGQPKFTFSPEFIEWAKANAPDLLRVKHEADANAAKEALTTVENLDGELAATYEGEIVPGVEVEAARVNYSVKTGDK